MLFEEMVSHNHLATYQAVLLKGRVTESISYPNFFGVREYLKWVANEIVATLEESTRPVLLTWKQDIKNGSYAFLQDLSRNHSKNFRLVLKDFVDFAFEKDRLFIKQLLDFAWHLYTIEQFGVFYDALLQKIKANNVLEIPEIFIFAQGIKQQMENGRFEILLESDKVKFNKMKNDLPSAVGKLIWSEVCLQSVEKTKFLTIEIMKGHDSKAEIVLTDECSLWKFETANGGESFHMKSVKLGKYFYENIDEGFLMTESIDEGKDWIIESFCNKDEIWLKQRNGRNVGNYWKIV